MLEVSEAIPPHEFSYQESKKMFQKVVKSSLRNLPNQKGIDYLIEKIHSGLNNITSNGVPCTVVYVNFKGFLCNVLWSSGESCKPWSIRQILSYEDTFNLLAELHMSQYSFEDSNKILQKLSNCYIEPLLIKLFLASCGACRVLKGLSLLDLDADNTTTPYVICTPIENSTSKPKPPLQRKAEVVIFSINEGSGFVGMLIYVDKLSNFIQLRPLKSITNHEIALALLCIFCEFGPPKYLDGYDFVDNVLEILRHLNLPFVLPLRPPNQTKDSLKVLTHRVNDMISKWMAQSNTRCWVIGAHVTQWLWNTQKHYQVEMTSQIVNRSIQSPYHALFGIMPHNDIVKLRDVQTEDTQPLVTASVNCSQCDQPIYKLFTCNSCGGACHITCCIRSVANNLFVTQCHTCVKSAAL